ncbi:hypothetical protein [Streptomyces sp. NPDC048560]|uniref:hypothetical protein n=1 Tax=Streptomyces sp. NPDC048560 TaxID=3155488 RepID=UPI003446BB63
MSTIVEFFVAPDDTSAATTLQTGPRRAYESLSFGNFDPEEAVVDWECLLTDGSYEELIAADEPRLVAGRGNSGCVVFAISPRLSAALAEATESTLREVAALWVAQRAEDGEVIETDVTEAILGDLASLVSNARHQGQGVYCWVA